MRSRDLGEGAGAVGGQGERHSVYDSDKHFI